METRLHVLVICSIIRNASGFCGSEPTGIKVSPKTASSAHVTWDVTNINCGYVITGYKVHFDSLSPVIVIKEKSVKGSTTDNVDIYPMVPGFTYKIYLMALSVNGEVSNPTFVNYTHPHTNPATAPPNIHASDMGITFLTVAWDALNPFTKNGFVHGYNVYYQGPGLKGTKHESVVGEDTRELKITGLEPKSTYMFILNVVNDVGPGPYSSRIYLTTLPLSTTATTTTNPMPTTTTTTTTMTTPMPTITTSTPITTTTIPTSTTIPTNKTTPTTMSMPTSTMSMKQRTTTSVISSSEKSLQRSAINLNEVIIVHHGAALSAETTSVIVIICLLALFIVIAIVVYRLVWKGAVKFFQINVVHAS